MRHLIFIFAALLTTACSSIPESLGGLRWKDNRGDRGVQVSQRDLAWCVEAVETRRSLLATCMTERGWTQAQ
ncbi:MAG: hypothetical protein ACKO1L_13070 [Brachymonas sp.]